MCVYSGLSSSGEMTTAKEETYKLARALGAPSNSQIIANVDYRAVGLLPKKVAVHFLDRCAGSFLAPEVERDLLTVPHGSLAKAVNFPCFQCKFLAYHHRLLSSYPFAL
jgi:hypothetical protein